MLDGAEDFVGKGEMDGDSEGCLVEVGTRVGSGLAGLFRSGGTEGV